MFVIWMVSLQFLQFVLGSNPNQSFDGVGVVLTFIVGVGVWVTFKFMLLVGVGVWLTFKIVVLVGVIVLVGVGVWVGDKFEQLNLIKDLEGGTGLNANTKTISDCPFFINLSDPDNPWKHMFGSDWLVTNPIPFVRLTKGIIIGNVPPRFFGLGW